MTELDGYLRAKHDISNRLQLLSAYLEMNDIEKSKTLVSQWMHNIHSEQIFLMLPWPNVIAMVIHYKIKSNAKVIFDVEHVTVPESKAMIDAMSRHLSMVPDNIEQFELCIKDSQKDIDFSITIEVSGYVALAEQWETVGNHYTSKWKIKK